MGWLTRVRRLPHFYEGGYDIFNDAGRDTVWASVGSLILPAFFVSGWVLAARRLRRLAA